MWTFTLLEEHSGNLEFCSPGNSHVKYLIFLSFTSPRTPSSCKHRAVCIPYPLAGCGEAPLEIRDPRAANPLCFGTYHQALPELDPAGFTAAPWGPWSPSSSGWGWGRQVLGANCSMAWHAGWQEVRHPCL